MTLFLPWKAIMAQAPDEPSVPRRAADPAQERSEDERNSD